MFKVFSGVLQNKKLDENDLPKINSFLFKRYISGHIDGLMFSSYINSYEIKADVLYEYYRCLLGKRNIKFIPFVKSKKNENDLEFIKFHYKCSDKVASEYLEVLSPQQIAKLKENYNFK